MFPTGQRTDPSHSLEFSNIVQARSTCVAEDGTLHVRGLEFAALHDDGTGAGDGALGDVQAVVVVFGKAEEHVDVSFLCGSAYLGHLRGIIREGGLDVFGC